MGNQDILVTQKIDGKVKLIRNFDLKKYSILDDNVFNNTLDSGLLGITSTAVGNLTYVFLYYVENSANDGSRISSRHGNDNRVYRYIWDPDRLLLSNKSLVLDLPATSSVARDGGKINIGPDNQLYTAIGDLTSEGREQNIPEDDQIGQWLYNNKSESGAILRTTIDGVPSKNNPFIEKGFESLLDMESEMLLDLHLTS